MIGKTRKYCAPRRIGYPLQLLDVVVDAYARGRYKRRNQDVPDTDTPRFLLLMSGHLGDALTLSYVFPLIRRVYPNCTIDVVAGDWCDPILAGNGYIRRLIHLNHVSTNRRPISRLAKWHDHIRTTRATIKLLKTETYTASVDVRFSDSPMHFLLPFIRVKKAFGFGSRGWGGLLDKEFFLPDEEFHHLALILNVLTALGVEADLLNVQPYFDFPAVARQTVRQKLPIADDRPLVLLFPESGQPRLFLPGSFWQQLAGQLLQETDCRIVGCGQLPQTTRLLRQIANDHPGKREQIHEAVNTLTLYEVAALSERAVVAITLESLPSHLCSIFCPTVSFFNNGMGLQFFQLANYPALVFHNHSYSRHLTLDQPDFTSVYVTKFDETVQKQALQWIQSVLVKKQL